MFVTEVGVATTDDDVRDRMRVEWIREHIDETLKSNNLQTLCCCCVVISLQVSRFSFLE